MIQVATGRRRIILAIQDIRGKDETGAEIRG